MLKGDRTSCTIGLSRSVGSLRRSAACLPSTISVITSDILVITNNARWTACLIRSLYGSPPSAVSISPYYHNHHDNDVIKTNAMVILHHRWHAHVQTRVDVSRHADATLAGGTTTAVQRRKRMGSGFGTRRNVRGTSFSPADRGGHRSIPPCSIRPLMTLRSLLTTPQKSACTPRLKRMLVQTSNHLVIRVEIRAHHVKQQ